MSLSLRNDNYLLLLITLLDNHNKLLKLQICIYLFIDYLDLSGCSVDSTKISDVYSINPTSNSSDSIYPKDVYCDMEKDDGGWTVSCC